MSANKSRLRRCFPIFLIGLFSCFSMAGQSEWSEYRDSSWLALEQIFWDSDDLLDFWPVLTSLETASIEAGDLDTFCLRAIPLAKESYEYGFFSEARSYLHHLDSLVAPIPTFQTTHHAEILFQLGRSYYFSNQADSVHWYTQRSIQCFPEESSQPYWQYNLLAVTYQHQGQLDSASLFYEQAITTGERNADIDRGILGAFYSNLGTLQHDLGKISSALENYHLALELKKNAWGEDHIEVGLTYVNLGVVYVELGRYTAAFDAYAKALDLYKKNELEDSKEVAAIYLNLGVSSKKNGAYEEALNYYRQAEQVYKGLQEASISNIALVNSNMSNVYFQQEDYEQAIAFQEVSLALNEQAQDINAMGNNYTNLGVVASEMNDWPEAYIHFLQALELRRQLPDLKSDLATDYINLADAHLALKEGSAAQVYADSAQQIQEELYGQRHSDLAYTYTTQARIAQSNGDLEEALGWVQRSLTANHQTFQSQDIEALPDLAGYLHYDYLFESFLLKADLLQAAAVDNPQYLILAHQQYTHAMDLLDIVRDELTSREDQITLARNVYRLSSSAIALSYQLYESTSEQSWAESAFYFAEKSKATVLLSSMAANEARYFAGIPDSLLAEEDRLHAELGYYKRQLTLQPNHAEADNWQSRLFAAQEGYKALLDRYEEEFPLYFDLRHARALPRISAIQFALEPSQVMVSYFTAEREVYRFFIGPDDFRMDQQALPARFQRQIVGLRKGIARRLDKTYIDRARLLYDLLIPEDIQITSEELILVPDGPLAQIPFEALLMEDIESSSEVNFSELPYLLSFYEVSYSPSASLYYQAQTTTTETDQQRTASGLLAYAPVFSGQHLAPGDRWGHQLAGQYIQPLPETQREVTELARLFLTNDHQATAYLFGEASEENMRRSDISSCRYLHIATHGIINNEEADLSGLLLYPDSLSAEDDILAVGEVYNLQLNAELVVLSACETGIGRMASGEGVLGFSRAFLYAGAENLLVSLWKVQDDATTELMIQFYKNLLENEDPLYADLLREAKLSLISSEQFSHPYFWSAFILMRG